MSPYMNSRDKESKIDDITGMNNPASTRTYRVVCSTGIRSDFRYIGAETINLRANYVTLADAKAVADRLNAARTAADKSCGSKFYAQ